ncbi:ribose-phosphate diphosphokinase [Thermosphaera aggregans]|uniref:ribose-phosphate diphosphokinase n=1 Tax=Thermosphaera aggregans (strain DSM 11486 / M11TL) TaxID=633148 RepID=D5TZW9_THEAM|nr:ribose-phosphate diphosphokinase [Thermosphaera aggregans]ADG90419.1 ribose-phosphate pyrophosphokinase [Thermosphaera aggregans DSM 11486]
MSAVIVPGRNYLEQAVKVASTLNYPIAKVLWKEFPDGEQYVRIENPDLLSSRTAVVVNTMYPGQDKSVMETLMLVDACLRAGAVDVKLVIPYLAYSRQDKLFLAGEPVSFSIVLKTLRHLGATGLVTVDSHNPDKLTEFQGRVVNLLVSDLLVQEALKYSSNPIVIAPDKGALKRAEHAAVKLGLRFDYLVKTRDRITGQVSYQPREIRIRGEDIIVVDDIISTGGTIAESSKLLLEAGASSVIVAATHGLLIGNALEKIRAAGVRKVILANTLGLKIQDDLVEYADVSGRVAEAIGKVLERVD